MSEISATEAAQTFADLLDAVEQRGERFTIIRRGQPVAHLKTVRSRHGKDVTELLRAAAPDGGWAEDLRTVRALVQRRR